MIGVILFVGLNIKTVIILLLNWSCVVAYGEAQEKDKNIKMTF